jgi:subtilase family serine protease
VRPSLKLLVSACAVAVCAAAPPLAAVAAAPAPTATLAGSVLPSVAHSTLLGHTSATASVRVEFVLRPSHAGLLAKMAAHSSGRTGLSQKVINRLFRPAPAVRAQVAAYMHARGFRPAGAGVLTQSFTGTAAQAERAFGVSLQNYRLADGTTYRAPAGAIHVPAALAPRVITVDGLNTLPLEHPAGLHHHVAAKVKPNLAPLSGCTGSNNAQAGAPGSFQPADLAAANAYNSQPLLTAGDVGTGESVGLVEFSGYKNTDQATFQTCYSISVPVTKVNVGLGNTSTGGGDEVALDQEVVASQAPGLDHIWTYVAPGNATMAAMLDKILATSTANGIHIISDSWGICEAAELASSQAATNAVLQLIAVKGISFFAASGDSGSSDCARLGFNGFQVDDPAVQQYATGVGGTHLVPANTAPNKERVWDDKARSAGGGGGVSQVFIMPGYQRGTGVIETGRSSKTRCGGKTHFCREVPDVSFDADPATGYVVNCTVASCTSSPGWNVFGGTSASAPLMAAFTADANQFSLANVGHRMGFANPFLYHEFGTDPSMFHDVTLGNNNILAGTTFPAGVGYDMASGLGSVDATQMATDLSSYTRAAIKIHASVITAGASRNPISAGHPTVLSGTLKDHFTHKFLPGRAIVIEGFILKSGNYKFFRVHTGLHGGWALKLTTTLIKSKFQWHAVYVGEPGHAPAVSPIRNLGVS